jgi:hypothetical protein
MVELRVMTSQVRETRQSCNDVFGQTFRQSLKIWIVTPILERQHSYPESLFFACGNLSVRARAEQVLEAAKALP